MTGKMTGPDLVFALDQQQSVYAKTARRCPRHPRYRLAVAMNGGLYCAEKGCDHIEQGTIQEAPEFTAMPEMAHAR